MSDPRFYAVIPAGGSGTRLWPLSRSGSPKFLHDLGGAGRSMIQDTADRLAALADPTATYVVTGAAHAPHIARQLPTVPADHIVVEPGPRDSAPAIALAAALIHRTDPDAVMGSFAADHVVADRPAFHRAVRTAVDAAAGGYLVTIGLTPTRPDTGYGYIRVGAALGGGAFRAEEFKEKPDAATARLYVGSGEYLWNASMFVWRVATFLDEVRRQLPELAAGLDRIVAVWDTTERDEVLADVWSALPKVNVDQGVMEDAGRRGRVATVPASIGWHDIGDWDTLTAITAAGSDGVVRLGAGEVLARDTEDTLVYAESGRLVATLGLRGTVVVDTPDALLIASRERAQEVKALVDELKARERTDLT